MQHLADKGYLQAGPLACRILLGCFANTKDVYTVPRMASSLKGAVMRDSREVSSSADAAGLPEVDAKPLPELCPTGRAPLTGLPLELSGFTPEAYDTSKKM